MTTAPSGAESLVFLNRSWVHALLVVVAVLLAFEPSLEGLPLWDDPSILAPAASLSSPASAFSTTLFGASPDTAHYYRPLVTLGFWADIRLFSAAPHVGLHLVNLLWHAAAAVFVLLAFRRWTRAEGDNVRGAACLVATLVWAVLPQKAESVAWISGRADAMGLTFLLAGLAIRARLTSASARVAVVLGATVLALLTKESFVVAPLVIALEVALERPQSSLRDRLREPALLGSAALTLAYLGLRTALLPIAGGGAAMFRDLSLADRASLCFETLGYAALGLVKVHDASLLPGPIGMLGPSQLATEPTMALVGVVFVVGSVALAVRVEAARPALWLLLTLLPVANLVPAGLESRFSDRFLYVPSLALCLGIAIAVPRKAPRFVRGAIIAVAIAAVLLLVRTRSRAALFASDDALFSYERAHGNRALAVLRNAGQAAASAGRYREARDLRLETAARYGELGYSGEGYDDVVAAARMQVLATGESQRDSMLALYNLLLALRDAQLTDIEVPFDDGHTLTISTASPQARDFAFRRQLAIRTWIAQLEARIGIETALDDAKALVAECPRCSDVLVENAKIALMSLEPDLALAWLTTSSVPNTERDTLTQVAKLQQSLLASRDPTQRAAARFLGQSFEPACKEARAVADPSPQTEELRSLTCYLAGSTKIPKSLAQLDDAGRDKRAMALRNDPRERAKLVTSWF